MALWRRGRCCSVDQESFILVGKEKTIETCLDSPSLSSALLVPLLQTILPYSGNENQKIVSGSIRLSGMERKDRRGGEKNKKSFISLETVESPCGQWIQVGGGGCLDEEGVPKLGTTFY